MTDSSDKPGNSRAAGTSSIASEDEVASRTPHETVRRSLNEATRFDAGPVGAAPDATEAMLSDEQREEEEREDTLPHFDDVLADGHENDKQPEIGKDGEEVI